MTHPYQYLDAGATISLAPGVRLLDHGLEDEISGHEYPVAGTGTEILERLFEGESVGRVGAAISDKYGVPANTVAGDIEAFMVDLDGQALISTRQSYWMGLRAFARSLGVAALSPMHLLMLDTSKLAQPTRRYPTSVLNVVLACVEAQSVLYLGAFGVLAVVVIAKMVTAWSQHADVIAIGVYAAARPVLALTIFGLLFVCHELGHLIAVRILRMKVQSVAVRVWAVGINYVPDRPFKMLLVAIAGPLSGFVAAVLIALLISFHPPTALGVDSLEVTYIVLFGLLHLWSLRPWAGDGRQALRALFALASQRRRKLQGRRGAV